MSYSSQGKSGITAPTNTNASLTTSGSTYTTGNASTVKPPAPGQHPSSFDSGYTGRAPAGAAVAPVGRPSPSGVKAGMIGNGTGIGAAAQQQRQFMNKPPNSIETMPTRIRQVRCLPPQCYPPPFGCPPPQCYPPRCYPPPCYPPPNPYCPSPNPYCTPPCYPQPYCNPCYPPPPPPQCYPCMPPPQCCPPPMCPPCPPPPCGPCRPRCGPPGRRGGCCSGGSTLICLPRCPPSCAPPSNFPPGVLPAPVPEQPASFNNCNFYCSELPKGFANAKIGNLNPVEFQTDGMEIGESPFFANIAAGDNKIVPPPAGYPGSNRGPWRTMDINGNPMEAGVGQGNMNMNENPYDNRIPNGNAYQNVGGKGRGNASDGLKTNSIRNSTDSARNVGNKFDSVDSGKGRGNASGGLKTNSIRNSTDSAHNVGNKFDSIDSGRTRVVSHTSVRKSKDSSIPRFSIIKASTHSFHKEPGSRMVIGNATNFGKKSAKKLSDDRHDGGLRSTSSSQRDAVLDAALTNKAGGAFRERSDIVEEVCVDDYMRGAGRGLGGGPLIGGGMLGYAGGKPKQTGHGADYCIEQDYGCHSKPLARVTKWKRKQQCCIPKRGRKLKTLCEKCHERYIANNNHCGLPMPPPPKEKESRRYPATPGKGKRIYEDNHVHRYNNDSQDRRGNDGRQGRSAADDNQGRRHTDESQGHRSTEEDSPTDGQSHGRRDTDEEYNRPQRVSDTTESYHVRPKSKGQRGLNLEHEFKTIITGPDPSENAIVSTGQSHTSVVRQGKSIEVMAPGGNIKIISRPTSAAGARGQISLNNLSAMGARSGAQIHKEVTAEGTKVTVRMPHPDADQASFHELYNNYPPGTASSRMIQNPVGMQVSVGPKPGKAERSRSEPSMKPAVTIHSSKNVEIDPSSKAITTLSVDHINVKAHSRTVVQQQGQGHGQGYGHGSQKPPGRPIFSLFPPMCPIRENKASILRKHPAVACSWHDRENYEDVCLMPCNTDPTSRGGGPTFLQAQQQFAIPSKIISSSRDEITRVIIQKDHDTHQKHIKVIKKHIPHTETIFNTNIPNTSISKTLSNITTPKPMLSATHSTVIAMHKQGGGGSPFVTTQSRMMLGGGAPVFPQAPPTAPSNYDDFGGSVRNYGQLLAAQKQQQRNYQYQQAEAQMHTPQTDYYVNRDFRDSAQGYVPPALSSRSQVRMNQPSGSIPRAESVQQNRDSSIIKYYPPSHVNPMLPPAHQNYFENDYQAHPGSFVVKSHTIIKDHPPKISRSQNPSQHIHPPHYLRFGTDPNKHHSGAYLLGQKSIIKDHPPILSQERGNHQVSPGEFIVASHASINIGGKQAQNVEPNYYDDYQQHGMIPHAAPTISFDKHNSYAHSSRDVNRVLSTGQSHHIPPQVISRMSQSNQQIPAKRVASIMHTHTETLTIKKKNEPPKKIVTQSSIQYIVPPPRSPPPSPPLRSSLKIGIPSSGNQNDDDFDQVEVYECLPVCDPTPSECRLMNKPYSMQQQGQKEKPWSNAQGHCGPDLGISSRYSKSPNPCGSPSRFRSPKRIHSPAKCQSPTKYRSPMKCHSPPIHNNKRDSCTPVITPPNEFSNKAPKNNAQGRARKRKTKRC